MLSLKHNDFDFRARCYCKHNETEFKNVEDNVYSNYSKTVSYYVNGSFFQ